MNQSEACISSIKNRNIFQIQKCNLYTLHTHHYQYMYNVHIIRLSLSVYSNFKIYTQFVICLKSYLFGPSLQKKKKLRKQILTDKYICDIELNKYKSK